MIRRYWSVFILALGLTAFIIAGLFRAEKPPAPGRLVAVESSLTWRGPSGAASKQVAIDAAQATFQFLNSGGTPVRIVDVSTTCGCTTPEFDRKEILLGQTVKMFAKAMAIATGERSVTITVTTDSPEVSKVVVNLRIIGSLEAPYLAQARGDVTFSGGGSDGKPRYIFADSVEKKGSIPTPPILENKLDYLEITGPVIKDDQPAFLPDAVNRRYVYTIKLKPSSGPYNDSGPIRVIDPWDPSHIEVVQVHREIAPPLRVVPARAILFVDTADVPAVAKFVVTSAEPIPDLVLDLEGEGAGLLTLSGQTSYDDNRRLTFTVTLRGVVKAEVVPLVSLGRKSLPDRIRVPIAIRPKEAR